MNTHANSSQTKIGAAFSAASTAADPATIPGSMEDWPAGPGMGAAGATRAGPYALTLCFDGIVSALETLNHSKRMVSDICECWDKAAAQV
jgi:hypothetical protein